MITDFLSRYRRVLSTLVFLVISFIMITFTESRVADSLNKVGFSILYPFEYMFNSSSKFFHELINVISERDKMRQQLSVARVELDQYRKMMVDFDVIMKENVTLRNTLELKNAFAYKSVVSQIIGRDPESRFDYLVIDKGSEHGIEENMIVVSYKNGRKALVGKVFQVTPFASKVITLNNPDLRVGVVIDYDGTYCVVQGRNSADSSAKLLYLPKDFTLDDSRSPLVYTSGDSYFYAKGIEIGAIESVVDSKRYEIYNEGRVKVTEDYSKLEFVLVLMLDSENDNFKSMENPF